MPSIVLYQPEIPGNTGAIGRLCLCMDAKLLLVPPLGFSIDEPSLRRAGLDYWQHLDWEVVEDFEKFVADRDGARFWYFSKKGKRAYWQEDFHEDDFLVFGAESRGLPESILKANPKRVLTIPMPGNKSRSLNLAMSCAIVLAEAQRQKFVNTQKAL